MQFFRARAALPVAAILSLFALSACSSDNGTTDVPTPPQITITGVADNVSYTGVVTIGISIDKGAYDAKLDGAPFTTGGTVSAPGTHILIVSAHQGTSISSDTVHFTIQGAPGGALIIRMFDLGTKTDESAPGDAILLTDSTSAGKVHVLIDAGPAGPTANDPGYVSRTLSSLGIDTLSVMLLTHAHGDHYSGMPSVLTNQKVKRFMYNGQKRTLASYTNMLAQAGVSADSVIILKDSIRTYNIGYGTTTTSLKFLKPLQTYIDKDTSDGTELNEGSVGMRLDLGTFSMFFTGDSEVEATKRWRVSYPSFTKNLSVLKVGHHGANNAIFDDGFGSSNKSSIWLDWTLPKTSIISGNGTSHPRIFALARLYQSPGNTVFCTNVHGMITITVTRDGSYTVKTEKNQSSVCQPGSTATT